MKSRLLLIAIGIIILATIFYIFIFKGTVEVVVSEVSTAKEGVMVSFSYDDYRRSWPVPAKVRLRPGSYTFIANAPGSITQVGTTKVTAFTKSKLSVVLTANPDAFLPGSNPTLSQINSVPYLKLFPYITGDYRIEAITDTELTRITGIQVTAIHHFFGPSEPTQFSNERDLAVAAAKKWLVNNSVPDSFPITVKDEY